MRLPTASAPQFTGRNNICSRNEACLAPVEEGRYGAGQRVHPAEHHRQEGREGRRQRKLPVL
jgi:hypothetical protein